MNKKEHFLSIFNLAQQRFGKAEKRLAGDGWKYDWQTLIATIMSAQTRDEVTIPVAEKLFARYLSLEDLANADVEQVRTVIRSVNFSRVKSKNVVAAANYLIDSYHGKVPDSIELLTAIPGVGRKTANLVLSEVHNKQSITVDTHVHRIANVLGLVKTKTPTETEFALMKIAPQKYWSQINRLFVLWGKSIRGHDKKTILSALHSNS
jgi:endonuclease-3